MTGRATPVRGRATFQELTRSQFRSRSGPIRVHFSPDLISGSETTVAYAVSRKIGGAVVRNRCRRRLRAIVAEFAPELPRGAYLISVGIEVHDLNFAELRERAVEAMRTASGSKL